MKSRIHLILRSPAKGPNGLWVIQCVSARYTLPVQHDRSEYLQGQHVVKSFALSFIIRERAPCPNYPVVRTGHKHKAAFCRIEPQAWSRSMQRLLYSPRPCYQAELDTVPLNMKP